MIQNEEKIINIGRDTNREITEGMDGLNYMIEEGITYLKMYNLILLKIK